MNHDNPYRSPDACRDTVESPVPDGSLVRRGEFVYLAIAVSLLVLEVAPPVFLGTDPALFRLTVLSILLIAGWAGQGWAVALLAVLIVVNVLVTTAILVQAMAAGSWPAMVGCLVNGVAGVVILSALFKSRSLNAFLKSKHPSKIATEDGKIPERNLVSLSAAAADLFRRNVAERGFPPETALRVVLADHVEHGFDVRYDVVSEDGHDWVGESSGVTVLVSKEMADKVEGLTIDAQDGAYVFRFAKGAGDEIGDVPESCG